MAPRFPPPHGGEHRPGHQVKAPDVGAHGGVPLLQRQLLERLGDEHPGIVHQHIGIAQRSSQVVHRPLRLIGVADVGGRTCSFYALAG